jgi:hypothetical protein
MTRIIGQIALKGILNAVKCSQEQTIDGKTYQDMAKRLDKINRSGII